MKYIICDSSICYSKSFCTRCNSLNKSDGTLEDLDNMEYSVSVILIEDGETFIKSFQSNTKGMSSEIRCFI